MKNLFGSRYICLVAFFGLGLFMEAFRLEPAATITRAELRDHVIFLASDELRGRVIYEETYKIAAQYCASQFRQTGLMPINKTKDNEAFCLEVPFVKKSPRAATPMTVINGASTHTFDGTTETRYLFMEDVSVFAEGTPVVFAGYGIHTPEYGWNDLEGVDLDGKLVLVLAGVPKRNDQPVLPSSIHEEFDTSNPMFRWYRKYLSLAKHDSKPAAIVIIADEIINKRWESLGGKYEGFKVYLAKDASKPESEHNAVLISRDIARALFRNQVYNPIASQDVALDGYKTFELKNVGMKFVVEFKLEEFSSWNVIGMVPGSDPELKGEYIIVGGHLDHVPPSRGQIMNGADDNASGCAGVLEVAEAIASPPPRRSVIFCLWTGEEPLRGDHCMGSKLFVENPPVPIEKIKAYINLDMIGRTRPDNEGDRAHIIGSTEAMMSAVEALVKPVNNYRVKWPIVYEEMVAGDHMRFLDAEIPAFTFYSGDHGDEHTPNDDPEKIDYEKMENLSRLAYWITFELANGSKILEFHR